MAEVSRNMDAQSAMLEARLDDMRAMMNETLDPELEGWVEESETFGTMLRHPLVYQIPLLTPGHANLVYAQKQALLEDAVLAGRWHSVVWLHERPYRLNALIDYVTGRDEYEVPLPLTQEHADLAAAVWVDSENIEQHIEEWRHLLGQPGQMPNVWLGAEEERAEFNALPRIPGCNGPLIKAWRGGSVGDWSWTTDRGIAEFFSRRSGCPIRSHLIPVSDVFGYLTQRGESELMVKFTEFRRGLVYP